MIDKRTVVMKSCIVDINEHISRKNAVWFAQEVMEIIRDGADRIVVRENEIKADDFKGLRTIYKVLKILRKRNIQIQLVK